MKTITYYQCGICNSRHDTKKDALECEAEGKPWLAPLGLVFGEPSKRGAFHENMTFATAKVWAEGHTADATLWACRDNGAGYATQLG